MISPIVAARGIGPAAVVKGNTVLVASSVVVWASTKSVAVSVGDKVLVRVSSCLRRGKGSRVGVGRISPNASGDDAEVRRLPWPRAQSTR